MNTFVNQNIPILENKVQCDLSLSFTTPSSITLEGVCGELKSSYHSLRLDELGEVIFHSLKSLEEGQYRGFESY